MSHAVRGPAVPAASPRRSGGFKLFFSLLGYNRAAERNSEVFLVFLRLEDFVMDKKKNGLKPALFTLIVGFITAKLMRKQADKEIDKL